MDEYPSVVFVIFFNAVILLLDMSLVEKAQHFLLELSAALAGDDLSKLDLLVHGFFHDAVKLRVDLVAFIIDVVQVQF